MIALWFAATLGAATVTGSLASPVLTLLPNLASSDPMRTGLGLFVAGTAALIVLAWTVAAMSLAWRHRVT